MNIPGRELTDELVEEAVGRCFPVPPRSPEPITAIQRERVQAFILGKDQPPVAPEELQQEWAPHF